MVIIVLIKKLYMINTFRVKTIGITDKSTGNIVNFTYPDPFDCKHPKGTIVKKVLLENPTNEGLFTLAIINYKGQKDECLAIRWNVTNNDPNSKIGLPNSRGYPTWFVLPDILKAIDFDKLIKNYK